MPEVRTAKARIGVHPSIWTNEDLATAEPGRSGEMLLAEAHATGAEGIELSQAFPRDSDGLRGLFVTQVMSLAAARWGTRLLERAAQEEFASLEGLQTLLRHLGAKVLVVSEHTRAIHRHPDAQLSSRPTLDDAGWRRLCQGLTRLADELAGQGFSVAYQPRAGTVVHTEHEIDRLMSGTQANVGLLLDTADLAFAGIPPARVVQKHGPRIKHVHLGDVRPANAEKARAADLPLREAAKEGVFCLPGEGAIDFVPVLDALAASQFNGWLILSSAEEPGKVAPTARAKAAVAKVTQLAGAHGIKL